MTPPRFAIVNTTDAPSRTNVAEWVEGIGYCYMDRSVKPNLKDFDGMMPMRPTPIEDFGFAVLVRDGEAYFVRARESVATYEDGKMRHWQDVNSQKGFTLPLVIGVKKPGKQIRKTKGATL